MAYRCFLSVFKGITLRPNLTKVYSQSQNVCFYGLTIQVKTIQCVKNFRYDKFEP